MNGNRKLMIALLLGGMTSAAWTQVYSPKVLTLAQVDSTDLAALADGIYKKAGAVTPRQRAEAQKPEPLFYG